MSNPPYPPERTGPAGAGPQPGAQPAYPSPQRGAQPVPLPPRPGGQPAHRSAQPANPLGVVSVVVGAVPLLISLGQPFIALALLRAGGGTVYGIVTGALNGVALLLGVVAIVIGIIAITRPGLPKAIAGIGIGLGIAVGWGALTGFLFGFVLQFA